MGSELPDGTAREVAAMQFAGGMSIARIAAQWEREAGWVEESIRVALLEYIPRRDGGLKRSRMEMRAQLLAQRMQCEAEGRLQAELGFEAEGGIAA